MEKAEECKNKGNTAFQAKNYLQAITQYTLGLSYNPNHLLLYSNRSYCYYLLSIAKNEKDDKLKYLTLAWKDVKVAQGLDNKFWKLYYRSGQILNELKSPNQATKFLLVSDRLLNQTENNNTANRSSIYDELQNKSLPLLNQNLKKFFSNPKNHKLNPQIKLQDIVSSFSNFEVKWINSHKGRGVFAKSKISKNQIIFYDFPLISEMYHKTISKPTPSSSSSHPNLNISCENCFQNCFDFSRFFAQHKSQHQISTPFLKFLSQHPTHSSFVSSFKKCEHCAAIFCSEKCFQFETGVHEFLCPGTNPQISQLSTLISNPTEFSVILTIIKLMAHQILSIVQKIQRQQQQQNSKDEVSGVKFQNENLVWIEKQSDRYRSFSSPSIGTVWKESETRKTQLTKIVSFIKEIFHRNLNEKLNNNNNNKNSNHSSKYLEMFEHFFSERSFEQMFIQVSMNALKFNPRGIFEQFADNHDDEHRRITEAIITDDNLEVSGRKILDEYWVSELGDLVEAENFEGEGKLGWPGTREISGMFPILTLANHSDHPNCIVVDAFEDSWVQFKALRDIEEGEELSYDYLIGVKDETQRNKMKKEWMIEDKVEDEEEEEEEGKQKKNVKSNRGFLQTKK